MSKDLEAFGLVKRTCELYIETTRFLKGSDIIANQIKEALNTIQNRLEAIDNANHSEALECLEALEQDIKDRVILAEDRQLKLCAVIKQALLKAQEPKHYLKWEDLEFKKETQEMHILLNGNLYFISFGLLFGKTQQVELYSKNEEHLMNFNSYYPEDIQFFNDLHLERVEE